MNVRIPLVLSLVLLAACSKSSEETATPPPTPAGPVASLPATLRLDAAPASPLSVVDARKGQDGSEVVVVGRVKDLVATRAVFTIADLSLKSCAEPGDTMNCETPWDYCCEDPARLAAGTATVEVREGERPFAGTVQGWNGLDHLKQVVVRGKLAVDAKGNASVIANGIYVGS